MSINAIGYLRRDVSGVRQAWDETQIRSLARRLGYNLRKIIATSTGGYDTGEWLGTIAVRVGADAVFIPSVQHFDCAAVPPALVEAADVITVEPEYTYARWADGQLPAELGETGGTR